MLRFLKIFAGKMDILSVNTTSLCKQKCYLIGCQEKRPFFRRKSLTLVILTLTPGIDFTKLHYGRKHSSIMAIGAMQGHIYKLKFDQIMFYP
jgi:hypothetical protein